MSKATLVTTEAHGSHDLTLQGAHDAVAEAERGLVEARTADNAMRPGGAGVAMMRLRALETAAEVERAEAALAAARRHVAELKAAGDDRVHETRRPGRLAAVRAAFRAAEVFSEAIAALDAYDSETARLAGRRDDSIFGGLVERMRFEHERAGRAGWI